MEEVWKDIAGYEELYMISSYGRVWSCRRRKLLKPYVSKSGYSYSHLSKNGNTNVQLTHRLVALTFVNNDNVNAKCVNHIDENKLNNNFINLEWCTHKENNNHGTRIERITNSRNNSPKWKSLMTPIVGVNASTGETLRYSSVREADKDGFNHGAIWNCLNKKRKTHKGYKWYKQ